MNRYQNIFLIGLLVVAGLCRFYGLGWGANPEGGEFHRFHPDETTVIEAAGDFAVRREGTHIPYGKIPVYVLGITARIAGVIVGITPFDTQDNSSVRFTYVFARGISALFGTLTVWIVFAIGKRLGGFWIGLGSAALIAFSPIHIQQSHFYTVDTTFTFWASLALLLVFQLPSNRLLPYVLCGIVCGVAAGTRLIGVLLVVPFVVTHLVRDSDGSPLFQWGDFFAQLKIGLQALYRPLHFGIALLGAAVFAVLGEPDLLFNMQNVTGSRDVFLFGGAVKVATGEMVQIWTLYDYATWPYVHYLTHLIPQSLGWPAALVGLVGIVIACWHRSIITLILLAWMVPYFFMVGGLHAKPIRYAIPLLPAFSVISTWAVVTLGKKISQHQWALGVSLIIVVLPTVLLGLAQMRIYASLDSRFAAEDWIANNIPKNDAVLVEQGGFPTGWMVSSEHRTNPMHGAYFLDAEGFLPYWGQVNFIQSRLDDMKWIVLIKENRMQQYLAVPDRYPIASSFYQRLHAGGLGFELVADFKVSPGIGFWNRSEINADPTVTAFDHPHVMIYRRKDQRAVDKALTQWAYDVSRSAEFPDAIIQKGVEAYRAQSYPTASYHFQQAVDKYPDFVLAYLMLEAALNQQNRSPEAMHILKKAQDIHKGLSLEAGSGLLMVGMKEEGARFIENMLPVAEQAGRADLDRFANIAAKAWFDVGVGYQQAQQYEDARASLLKSARLDPNFAPLYIHLGEIAEAVGNREAAVRAYEKFLELNPKNESIRARVGELRE